MTAPERIRAERCRGCKNRWALAVEDRSQHLELTGDMWPNATRRHICTAPSEAEIIEELAAEVERLKAQQPTKPPRYGLLGTRFYLRSPLSMPFYRSPSDPEIRSLLQER
jgi:hypothetical protein